MLAIATLSSAMAIAQQTATIYRDAHGVPHVHATSDRGAFYGAGYAAAQDRLFQMHWFRLRYQGRTAEFFGPGTAPDGSVNNKYVNYDKDARVLGFRRHAAAVVAQMPAEHLDLLHYYAAGVNAAVAATPPGQFTSVFQQYEIVMPNHWEPWTPTDCLGVWYQFAELFQGLDYDEIAKRATVEKQFRDAPPAQPADTTWQNIARIFYPNAKYDNDAASVLEADVSLSSRMAMDAFKDQHGIAVDRQARHGVYSPTFSQAVALGGSRVDTGHSVLVGMPRISVTSPNIFHELHMEGRNFNVRGAAVAGCPFILVGSSSFCAWSATKLGLDMEDMFLLHPPSQGSGDYVLDGTNRTYDPNIPEAIKVKGGQDVVVFYRRSHFGPVIDEILDNVPAGRSVAIKRVPFDRTDTSEVAAFLGMYRATRLTEFYPALQHLRFPSCNLVFAGPNGSTGYAAVGAIPVRAFGQELPGSFALDGNSSSNDWQTYVPHDLRPHVLNPTRGYTVNGNSAPIGSWYPLKALVPGVGDTARSRILRDIVERTPQFAEATLLQHADLAPQPDPFAFLRDPAARNPFVQSTELAFVRDLIDIAVQLESREGSTVPGETIKVLEHLGPWLASGARLDRFHPASALAQYVPHTFPSPTVPSPALTSVIAKYGARPAGMSLWLRELRRRLTLESVEDVLLHVPDEVEVVDMLLAEAWRAFGEATFQNSSNPAVPTSYPTPQAWTFWYVSNHLKSTAFGGRQNPLDLWRIATTNHGPLVTEANTNPFPGYVEFNSKLSRHTETLTDHRGSCFNQVVPLRNPDLSRSLLALGQSEQLGSPHQFDQVPLWEIGGLKASPMQIASVQAASVGTPLVLQVP
jgi:acyl-homoserine lactone acylase PvdQ